MKKLLIASALIAAGTLCLQDISAGHGGTYRGPGDTVPPGGGGGGGAPGTPGSGGPATGGPAGPGTPGPAGPGSPAGGGASPITGGGATGPDLTLWQYWWGFNREPYLNLKARLGGGATSTGSDEFYLGRGEQQQARDTMRPNEETIRSKVVPALIKALRNENANDIVTGAMVALAKIGDAKDESGNAKNEMSGEIKSHLLSGSQEIQETAAVALGILANEANIPLLTALMFSDRPGLKAAGVDFNSAVADRTRAFAAYGLGLVGCKASDDNRKAIVGSLVKLLEGDAKASGQRDIPVACLTSLGLVPLPMDAASAPVDLNKGYPRPEQVTNRQEQLLWLMNYYLADGNPFLNRAHVPTAVARLLADVDNTYWLRDAISKQFVEDIAKLSRAQTEIKQSCIIALGQIGDCDNDKTDVLIREGLMKAWEDLADDQSKNFAMMAVGQAGGRPGKGEGSPTAGLSDKKSSPRGFLLERLAKGKSGSKSWAALSLAVMERQLDDAKAGSSSEATDALIAALSDSKAPDEVGALAIAVGIVHSDKGKATLEEKFEQVSQDEARGFVAIGLGLSNDSKAIESITNVLRKSKYKADLLKSAAIALGLLGDSKVVPELVAMLDEAGSLASQAAISSGLGFIGDMRSIDPLIKLLEDKQKTDKARGFAAVALGIVADKEDLPWNSKISVNINYRANTTTLTSPDLGTGILDIL